MSILKFDNFWLSEFHNNSWGTKKYVSTVVNVLNF